MMDKHGQQFMVGILIFVMAIIIFIGTLPAIQSSMNVARGCSYLNCGGYVDSEATGASCSGSNQTYTSTLREDSLSCTVIDLGIPYLILGVLVAGVSLLLHNKLSTPPPEQPYYGAGY